MQIPYQYLTGHADREGNGRCPAAQNDPSGTGRREMLERVGGTRTTALDRTAQDREWHRERRTRAQIAGRDAAAGA
jgi:hypothetical protein